MAFLNLAILALCFAGAIAMISSEKWIKQRSLLSSMTSERGVMAVICFSLAFSLWVVMELSAIIAAKTAGEETRRLISENDRRLKEIENRIEHALNLENKVITRVAPASGRAPGMGKLAAIPVAVPAAVPAAIPAAIPVAEPQAVEDIALSPQLATVEAAFKLAAAAPSRAEKVVARLDGQPVIDIRSRDDRIILLSWGDNFEYAISSEGIPPRTWRRSNWKLEIKNTLCTMEPKMAFSKAISAYMAILSNPSRPAYIIQSCSTM